MKRVPPIIIIFILWSRPPILGVFPDRRVVGLPSGRCRWAGKKLSSLAAARRGHLRRLILSNQRAAIENKAHSSWRRMREWLSHLMIGKLVEPRFTPSQAFDMAICVNVVRALVVSVVPNPAFVRVLSRAPLHQRGLPHPGIVIVLNDTGIGE